MAVGLALLLSVSLLALHFSEAGEIARLARRTQPSWLSLAMALQLATYLVQGEIWRAIGKAAGLSLSRLSTFELSVAKLFMDQALPSAGLSGTAAVSSYFERVGMRESAIMSGVLVNLTSYFVTYVSLLFGALLLLPASGLVRTSIMAAAGVFIIASLALVTLLNLLLSRLQRWSKRLPKFHALQSLASSLEKADMSMAHHPRLLGASCAWQAAIIVLDAATIWVLIQALGVRVSLTAVFSSFMISNLFRTLSVLPGGLGIFEGSSVVTLQWAGISVPMALSATLLFRALSFWLPMLPGAWLSRRFFGGKSGGFEASTQAP